MISMKDYALQYRRIIQKLVNESFPELKNKRIITSIKELKVGSMWASKKLNYFEIILDPKRNKLNNPEYLIGPFVHELIHFKNYSGIYGWPRCLLENIAFLFKGRLMAFFERKTDKETIERGYAMELYQNRIFRFRNSPKEYWQKYSKFYLSPKEIKSYAESIGKW